MFALLVTIGSGAIGIPIDDISPEAYMDGCSFTMIFAVAISVLAIIFAFIVKDDKVVPKGVAE